MKNLILACCVLALCACQRENWEAVDYGSIPEVDHVAGETSVSARVAHSSSSSLTVEWSLTGFSNRNKDNSERWRIGLYRDSDCRDQVVAWTWDALGMGWAGSGSFHFPSFLFSGLASGTSYYFRAQTVDGQVVSDVFRFDTDSFPIVSPEGLDPKPGDVILGENFSEFVWGTDPMHWSAGYVPEDMDRYPTLEPAEGTDPEGFIQVAETQFSFPLPRYQEKTRLKNWLAVDVPGHKDLSFRCGCVDLADSYHNFARLATPRLSCLGDRFATIRVSFQTAGALTEFNEPEGAMVFVVDDAKTFDLTEYGYPFAMAHAASSVQETVKDGWVDHEVILHNVRGNHRIGFRIHNYQTSLLRNVRIELVAWEHADDVLNPPQMNHASSYESTLTLWMQPVRDALYFKTCYRKEGETSWTDAPDAYVEAIWESPVDLEPVISGQTYEVRICAVHYSGTEGEPAFFTLTHQR
jgi:hypothetical protein